MTDVVTPAILTVDEETRDRMHDAAARAEDRLRDGVKLSGLTDDELIGLTSVREVELVILISELRRRRSAAAN